MDAVTTFRGLSRGARWSLIGGSVLLIIALADRSALWVLIALALIIPAGRKLLSATSTPRTAEPWPWPPEFRARAESMARAIDPIPERQSLLPPDERSSTIAKVATTKDALSRLISDKPPAWPWAVFASVLVQRRNAVQSRLRLRVSGYQPRPGIAPLSGRAYCETARTAMNNAADLVAQTEQYILSPAFTGAIGNAGQQSSADPDAIIAAANRLMDYHEGFLAQAETCLQTPVMPEARVFVADMGAFTLCPLLGYEQFIPTVCARIAEAQELLPYTKGDQVIALDDVTMTMEVPDGLTDHIVAHIKELTRVD